MEPQICCSRALEPKACSRFFHILPREGINKKMAKDSDAGRGGWVEAQHLFNFKALLLLTLCFTAPRGVFGLTISPGQSGRFSVDPGQELLFLVPVPSGQHLWFEVHGWNLDSVIEVTDHRGKELFTVQSPLARFGNDGALLKPNREGF